MMPKLCLTVSLCILEIITNELSRSIMKFVTYCPKARDTASSKKGGLHCVAKFCRLKRVVTEIGNHTGCEIDRF